MSSTSVKNTILIALGATLALATALPQPATAQDAPQPTQQQPQTTQTDARALTLSPREAIDLAIQQNPDLRLTRIESQRAELAVESAETRRTPLFTAEAGYRYGKTPSLSADGTRLNNSSSLTFSSRLAHTLPVGTQLAASAAFGRAVRDSAGFAQFGAAYDTSLGINISQPLLRGFGEEINNAAINSARLSQQILTAQQLAQANAITASVLSAYWDLWLAQQNVAIQQAALEIAQQNIENAEYRLETGAIAPADLIPLRLELTNLESSLVTARNLVRQRSAELANVTGQNPAIPLQASAELPELDIPSLENAMQLYKENSYELARLELAIENARLQARLAENDARPRLDAVASFELAGLDRDAIDSIAQLPQFNAFTAFAGLRLELPIRNRSAQAEAERANLAVLVAQTDYERSTTNANTRVLTLLNDAQTTQERIRLAQQSAELAKQSVEAQTARFDTGRGTSFDVVTALQRYQEAELRVVETQVDIIRRILSIDELTGQLLQRWDITL